MIFEIDQSEIDEIVESVATKIRGGAYGGSYDDAAEFTSVAIAELIAKGDERWLTGSRGAIVNRAVWRFKGDKERRPGSHLSLDSFRESGVEESPVELAVSETDFDSHVALREISDHPVLRRRLEAAQSGAAATLQPRGAHAYRAVYDDATVEQARRLRGEGLTLAKIAETVGATEAVVGYWCSREQRVRSNPGWDEDLALLAMRLFAEEEGRRPTAADFHTDPRLPSSRPLERIFGTKNTVRKALAAAGWQIVGGPSKRYTGEEIRAAILDFQEREGRLPEYRDWRGDLPGTTMLYKRFGTTRAEDILDALEEAKR